jgi:tRNA nucleotidyltransferase/poly(A) polymerase
LESNPIALHYVSCWIVAEHRFGNGRFAIATSQSTHDRRQGNRLYRAQSIEFQFARGLVERLAQAGYVALFAGGCVRDAILKLEPHDFDIATSATLDQVRDVFGEKNTQAVGEAFGVVIVHGRQHGCKCKVEVATFRSDGAYSDGRRPDWVVYSSPEQDAQRRDFTINGLFYDPIAGRVIDYVEGQRDLASKTLRAIGCAEARFREDKLRMLRGIRFAARFDLEIDTATWDAIVAQSSTISVVSGERIGIELSKILEHPRRAWAWQQLLETSLLEHVLPEASCVENRPTVDAEDAQKLYFRSEDWASGIRMLEMLPPVALPAETALATVLSPWYDQQVAAEASTSPHRLASLLQAIKHRWKLPNQSIESVRFAIMNADVLLDADRLAWSRVQPLLVAPYAESALAVAAAKSQSLQLHPRGIEYCRARISEPMERWNPKPWLDGADLIRAGLTPGPEFSKLLAMARNKQLDGTLTTRAAALDWLAQSVADARP